MSSSNKKKGIGNWKELRGDTKLNLMEKIPETDDGKVLPLKAIEKRCIYLLKKISLPFQQVSLHISSLVSSPSTHVLVQPKKKASSPQNKKKRNPQKSEKPQKKLKQNLEENARKKSSESSIKENRKNIKEQEESGESKKERREANREERRESDKRREIRRESESKRENRRESDGKREGRRESENEHKRQNIEKSTRKESNEKKRIENPKKREMPKKMMEEIEMSDNEWKIERVKCEEYLNTYGAIQILKKFANLPISNLSDQLRLKKTKKYLVFLGERIESIIRQRNFQKNLEFFLWKFLSEETKGTKIPPKKLRALFHQLKSQVASQKSKSESKNSSHQKPHILKKRLLGDNK